MFLVRLVDAQPSDERQDIECAVVRSDYMLHDKEIKQIEINTISASFAGLSTRVSKLHRHVVASRPVRRRRKKEKERVLRCFFLMV